VLLKFVIAMTNITAMIAIANRNTDISLVLIFMFLKKLFIFATSK